MRKESCYITHGRAPILRALVSFESLLHQRIISTWLEWGYGCVPQPGSGVTTPPIRGDTLQFLFPVLLCGVVDNLFFSDCGMKITSRFSCTAVLSCGLFLLPGIPVLVLRGNEGKWARKVSFPASQRGPLISIPRVNGGMRAKPTCLGASGGKWHKSDWKPVSHLLLLFFFPLQNSWKLHVSGLSMMIIQRL